MDALINLVNRFKRLDVDKIIDSILNTVAFKEFIIDLNTEDQLFKDGINSLGVTLESIGGSYSPFTVVIKQGKGQPTDRVTLKDSGDFYKTFRVDITTDAIIIDANPIKDDTNLFSEWGEDILGLTDENLQLLINKLRDELSNAITQQILGN